MSWGLGTSILSPVLAILVAATAAWLLFTRTAFYGHLRLMGSDERAAYSSGVRISIVRLGAHAISGVFIGLAALSYTALVGSGDPTQGTAYTLIAVTALVLGGTSLAGGRGGVIGSLLGAVNLFLIGYVLATFNFGMVQGFVTDLAYGVILVLSLLLTVALPHVQRYIRRISPFLVFVVLSLLFAGVMLHAKYDYSRLTRADQTVGAVAPGSPAPSTAVTLPSARQAPTPFIIEDEALAGDATGTPLRLTPLQQGIGLAALLLCALVLFTRVSVAQTKHGAMTPLLYVSCAVIIVLGAWVLVNSMSPAPALPVVGVGG